MEGVSGLSRGLEEEALGNLGGVLGAEVSSCGAAAGGDAMGPRPCKGTLGEGREPVNMLMRRAGLPTELSRYYV